MIRNVFGAILFTIAVFAFVNFVGDMAIPQHGASTTEPEPVAVEPVAVEPTPIPAPTPKPVVEAAPAPEPTAMPTEVVAANALADDVAKGKKTFRRKCMSCHTIDKGGKDRTGPNLWGIVGRTKAASEAFRYSNTLKMYGGVWSEAEIGSFIAGPRTFMRDTKMTFPGLKSAQDRADVLAYLKTLAD